MATRLKDIRHLYAALDRLEGRFGGFWRSGDIASVTNRSGLYFFFEDGENRTTSGSGPRVVRVGKSTNLRARLAAHIGNTSFALPTTEGWHPHFHWHVQWALDHRAKQTRMPATAAASTTIGAMRFLWLPVEHEQDRVFLEDNATRLLTNFGRAPIDPASPTWLGYWSNSVEVRQSHLWNIKTVKSPTLGVDYDPEFLHYLRELVRTTDLS